MIWTRKKPHQRKFHRPWLRKEIWEKRQDSAQQCYWIENCTGEQASKSKTKLETNECDKFNYFTQWSSHESLKWPFVKIFHRKLFCQFATFKQNTNKSYDAKLWCLRPMVLKVHAASRLDEELSKIFATYLRIWKILSKQNLKLFAWNIFQPLKAWTISTHSSTKKTLCKEILSEILREEA